MKIASTLALATIVGVAASANAQITAVTNVPGAFIDISATGTSLGLTGVDDATASFTATHGNRIMAAGSAFASTNGLVGVVANSGFTNGTTASTAIGTYAVYWDDLHTRTGEIFVQNLSDRTIVQWNNVQHFSTSPSTVTFQLQIFDEGGPVLAQCIYQDIDFGDANSFGASATMGVHALDDSSTEFSMNTASIQDGSIISYVVPAPSAVAGLGLVGLAGLRRRR